MSYRIKLRSPLDRELKRIAGERIDDSLQYLEHPYENLDATAHEVRKNMKKIRGLLRLFRNTLPGNQYSEWNHYFRDLARGFSDVRDARVYLDTLDQLNEEKGRPVATGEISGLLQAHYDNARRTMEEQQPALMDAFLELQNSRSRLDELTDLDIDIQRMRKGLKRVYKRGRKAMSAIEDHPDGVHFHELRKRVKYLWYHMRLLQDVWPRVIRGHKKVLDKLSDDLGREHDLFELQRLIGESELMKTLPDADKQGLSGLIMKKRREVRSGAWSLARKIYLEKPAGFSDRITGYWKVSDSSVIVH